MRIIEVQPFLLKLKQIFADAILDNPNISAGIRPSLAFRLRVHFFAGGMVQLYRKWLLKELDCSMEALCAEISLLIQSWLPPAT